MTTRVMTFRAFQHSYLGDEYEVHAVKRIDQIDDGDDYKQHRIKWHGAERFRPGDVVVVEQRVPAEALRYPMSVSVFACGADRDMHEVWIEPSHPGDWSEIEFIHYEFTTNGDVDAAKVKAYVTQAKRFETQRRKDRARLAVAA